MKNGLRFSVVIPKILKVDIAKKSLWRICQNENLNSTKGI